MILELIKKTFELIHQKRSLLNKTLFINKKRLWNFLTCFCLSSLFVFSQLLFSINPAFALSNICGTPGNDGPTVLTGVINAYYPGTASASSGASSIAVGAAQGASTPINAGDLLLVIQMQDASISSSNDANYGGNNGTGTGYTSLNTAGSYQYVLATNTVPVSGGTVTLAQPLSFTFTNANATAANGQKRFQVIRVPQYSSATISSTVTSYGWNGSVGGVVAFDVTGSLTFSGAGTIDVDGQGFRGGGGTNIGGTGSGSKVQNSDYVHVAPTVTGIGSATAPTGANNYDASKGEGIAGTPRYTRNGGYPPVTGVTDNVVEGYPQGSFGRGAPANAGGGATDANKSANSANDGGGGGANAGAGGQGGDTWTDNSFTPARQPFGGLGGTALNPSANLIFLGGGGGAGTSNNSTTPNQAVPSGGGGGGMVIVRSGQILGSGSVTANGILGVSPSSTDGGGGGGAGGTILMQSVTASTPTISITANGGDGVNSGHSQHGPGGGGGGGYIAYQGFTPTTQVNPGAAGFTLTGSTGSAVSTDHYGAVAGSNGLVQSTTIPPAQVKPGASCIPSLTVTKTTSTPTVILPTSGNATATYTIVANNSSTTGIAVNVSISDLLPSPKFTYASTTSITLTGGATQPSVTNPNVGDNNPTWKSFTIPSGGQVQITFNVNISSAAALQTYQNPATATYSDPTRTTAGATVTSSYNPASSTGEDVTLVARTPKLELVKRITNVTRGGVSISPSGSDNLSIFNDDPSTIVDNDPNWPTPNTYLKGAINGGAVAPADILEYTIYFLSSGNTPVTNVNICDLVPANTTFINNAYNGMTPLDTGSAGGNLGIALANSSTALPTAPTAYMSSAIDGDRGSFYPTGTIPTPTNPCVKNVSGTYSPIANADNTNGLVLVNVVQSPTTLPYATTSGTPSSSYGFIRFTATVN